jgi:hypothetical protein
MNSRRSICVGYANLTAALLRAKEIPAKTVSGYGRITTKTGTWTLSQLSGNEINHVWNEAYINGRWIIIDTTWDSGNDYRGGKKTSSDGLYYSRYFDPTLEAISIDHRIHDYAESAIPKPDNPSPWAARSVNTAISAGLVPLKMRAKYTQATTRAEFCVLAVNLYEHAKGTEITGRVKFSDTSDVNVEKMAYLGVVNGVGGNKFSPDATLNREQAAIIIIRLADALGIQLSDGQATSSDSSSISAWAIEAVGKVQSNNIMSGIGDNEFSPKGKFTREQSIVAIIRLNDLLK